MPGRSASGIRAVPLAERNIYFSRWPDASQEKTMKPLTADQLLYLRRSTVDGVWAWPTGADILRWRAAVRRGLARETSERLDYVGTRVPVFEALAEEPQRWSEA